MSPVVAGCNPNSVTAPAAGGKNAIAVVDAYDYPTAATDLAYFSRQFNLPAATFSVVYGSGRRPSQDPTGGWELEAALDIEWAHALAPGAKILAAVSGGPDSVALAHFLRGQPYSLVIGHVDHRLRKGSAADARFVERLASAWDLPCQVQTVNVRAYAKARHIGLEEAARDLRYEALSAMARRHDCAAILTAHHAGDQAETVLMNFLRGSGPAGLAGMAAGRRLRPAHDLLILRPFLDLPKASILTYLRRYSLTYRKDPSNRSRRFARNRIRHLTLPYLEKLYPGLSDRLARAANIFREEEDFWHGRTRSPLSKTARKNGQKIEVVLPQLLRYHKALSRRMLRGLLPGLSFQDIEHLLTLARSPQRTGWLSLSGNWRVRRLGNKLVAVQKRTG